VPIFIAAKKVCSLFSVTFVTLCQKQFYTWEETLAPRVRDFKCWYCHI